MCPHWHDVLSNEFVLSLTAYVDQVGVICSAHSLRVVVQRVVGKELVASVFELLPVRLALSCRQRRKLWSQSCYGFDIFGKAKKEKKKNPSHTCLSYIILTLVHNSFKKIQKLHISLCKHRCSHQLCRLIRLPSRDVLEKHLRN